LKKTKVLAIPHQVRYDKESVFLSEAKNRKVLRQQAMILKFFGLRPQNDNYLLSTKQMC
jgi:hypothetical protein